MKKFFVTASLLLSSTFIFSQDIAGLWKGTMYNDSTRLTLPYEMLIKKEKGKYTGFTYTRFLIGGQEYYGIKKVKVSVAKDGKIVILDDKLLENNYPVPADKSMKQLNVLDLLSGASENTLDGVFVTNMTKHFTEVTGHINVKRTSVFTESSLMQYLQKDNTGIDVAVVK
ncbi:MAG: hypothetical protein ACHQEB_05595 [Chitinophagales bacterium]